MTVRERILETALRSFRTYGVKSVTMFDIARECGISKKTVYEHFTDKEALVQEGIETLLEGITQQMNSCREHSENAIEEIMQSTQNIVTLSRTINPVMMYEVQKYHPQTGIKVEQFKRDCVLQHIKGNLERGIKEGWYHSHFSMDIIARMRQLQLESAFDAAQYPPEQFNMQEVLHQVTVNFIMGIATPEGHRLAGQYLQLKEKHLSTT